MINRAISTIRKISAQQLCCLLMYVEFVCGRTNVINQFLLLLLVAERLRST